MGIDTRTGTGWNTHFLARFEIGDRGSTVWREITGGISLYLSVSYIFIVNPTILAQSGIAPGAALFATVVAAALATFAMGLWANLPFAVAPGLTMNSYFVFIVCKKLGFTWQEGLAIVFASGALCVVLTVIVPVRQRILAAIPEGLKSAIAVTVGVFVMTIGLFLAKLLTFGTNGILFFSAPSDLHWLGSTTIVFIVELATAALLSSPKIRFPGAILASIIVGSLLCAMLDIGAGDTHDALIRPLSAVAAADPAVFLRPAAWIPIVTFFVLDFFEGIGEFVGLTANTSIQAGDGSVKNMSKGLFVDGIATMVGASLGTSSLIIFVESAIGIRAGARTGMTAVICGMLMLATGIVALFLAPSLALIPAEASAGALVYVGLMLTLTSMRGNQRRASQIFDLAVTAAMALACLLTFALDKALALGFLAYFVKTIFDGKPQIWLGLISSVFLVEIVCHYVM